MKRQAPLPQRHLYIGLDAGGTKTALLARAGRHETPVSLKGPAANLQRQGEDTTAQVLVALVRQAVDRYPDAVLAGVCAGVAGAGYPVDQQSLAARVRGLLHDLEPFHLAVTHDGAIALEAAFEGGSGVMIIAGTGSILFARTRTGDTARAGGWGYLLGDEGSGHALGIHGLRAVAHAYDGGPPTRLQALLADRHGLDTPGATIHSVYREGWPVHQMAPLVLEAAEEGDAVARRIVADQTQALARQAVWLAGRSDPIETRLALLGGLTRSAYYKKALSDALTAALPGWRIQEPLHPPVVGALRLAVAATSS